MKKIPERIGKYTVETMLGKGASGMVLRGFDASIHRPVALKVIAKAELDWEAREHIIERFRVEARAVGRLTHPRIAAIYEFIEDEDLACIVMELVNGKSLQVHLKEERHFELKDAWEIVRQILDGIGYSHGQGVVHRDLKPANVLINDDGRIKITDFGVARLDSSTLTQVGDIVGTPHYMAPEQFTGLPSTASTDLYQVGVMTYELLTGQRPFTGNNAQLLHAVLHTQPANPATHNPKISAGLAATILRSIEKEPDKRFPGAREFSEALRRGFEESLGAASPATGGASLMDKARMAAGGRGPAGVEAPLPPGTFSTTGDARKARVLFVDDEERILTALRALFRNQYHVFTAENGALALELARRFGVHVVVSDQRMPNLTGVDLLRQVKAIQPHAVRMLLTGYSDLASVVGSINDGEVFRFVRKPWDEAEIRKTLADAVAIALELAALGPARTPAETQASVLVVDPSNDLAEGLGQLLPSSRVRRAANPAGALKALEGDEVGVIVADLAAGKEHLVAMFKLLKTEYPEIVTILVTETADAELAIELINQAQIFRLLEKPIDAGAVRKAVAEALSKYASFQASPELSRQHAVAAGTAGLTDWGARMLKSIRALPRRIFSRTP